MTRRELERLAREQRPALHAFARTRARSQYDAEDAVQEALTAALAARERIRTATALAYIGVSARHAALQLSRQSQRAESLDRPPSGSSRHELVADPRITDVEGRLDVLAGLRSLKRDQARALAARALGYSYREIAEGFGWSYTKTNRCISEGRARLRKLVAADTSQAPSASKRAAA